MLKINLMSVMMRTILFGIVLSLTIAFTSQVFAQDISNEVFLEIGGEKTTVDEFLQIYKKNNAQASELDPKSLEEYLELYINFRLKVLEAQELGIDQEPTFIEEFSNYRAQLAKPYLVDSAAVELLVKEAYTRMQEDIRASHLLIRVAKNASPQDTLASFNQIMELRNRIVAGETFAEMAFEYSEDQSARDRESGGRMMRGNRGDLGYFSAFDMVYAFESAAFALKKGDLSMPVRTDFGFHLIYITDRKPAMGQVLAAHILLLYPVDPKAQDSAALKEKIVAIYDRLQQGESFEDLAREFSDDRSTSVNGGVLQRFGSNRMIPEFIYQISLINEPGGYSQPFDSHYGWHLIKLLEQDKPGTFEESYTEIRDKVQRNERSVVIKESLANRIKKEYGFQETPRSLNKFYEIVTDSIFSGTWEIPPKTKLNAEMFAIGSKKFTQQDFADYLLATQRRRLAEDLHYFVDISYKSFVEQSLVDYEDSHLEKKYPEFRALVREYHDGILLFEITDRKIWSKAVQDTIGLAEFYEQTKYNYMWGERVDASVFVFNDSDAALVDEVKQLVLAGTPNEHILEKFNEEGNVLTVEQKFFQQGDSEIIDKIEWTKGLKEPFEDGGKTVMVLVHNILEPMPKQLNEVRGLVTADYQNYLERKWVEELRAKYPVSVNRELISQMTR